MNASRSAIWPYRCTGSSALTTPPVARLTSRSPRSSQLLRDRCANGGRIEVERRGIDVAEERPRTEPRDDACGREERERRRDDLVAGADVERHQREQQRIGARRQAEAVLRLRVGGDLAPRARRLAGPRTKRCSSQTSRMAASISARNGAYWPFRSSNGTCMVAVTSLADENRDRSAAQPRQRR